jgi:hypothetical protein
MAGQPGFFDVDERYASLSAAGDPLERLRTLPARLKLASFITELVIGDPSPGISACRDMAICGGSEAMAAFVPLTFAPGEARDEPRDRRARGHDDRECGTLRPLPQPNPSTSSWSDIGPAGPGRRSSRYGLRWRCGPAVPKP